MDAPSAIATRRTVKVVVSDIHMGTGARPGLANPYEDFHHDDRLAELMRHYAGGEFADADVEMVIAGDFLDLLKVPYRGRFETEVTEEIALDKVRRCVIGHPEVFDALAAFAAAPGHRVTYITGNHDLEVAFPRVQDLLRARLGLAADSGAIQFLPAQEFYRLPGGVVVTHGHMFEAVNRTDAIGALTTTGDGRTIVKLPFGSQFFVRVLAPVKAEQPLIDLVHPLSSFILWGLLFDLRFTLRVLWRMAEFILTTHVRREHIRAAGFLGTVQMLFEEVALSGRLERRALRLLRSSADVGTLIVGHSHGAKVRRFPRGKVYVNTGTWVRLVSLDLHDLGTRNYLTYALVEYRETGAPSVRLMRWRGVPRSLEEVVA